MPRDAPVIRAGGGGMIGILFRRAEGSKPRGTSSAGVRRAKVTALVSAFPPVILPAYVVPHLVRAARQSARRSAFVGRGRGHGDADAAGAAEPLSGGGDRLSDAAVCEA